LQIIFVIHFTYFAFKFDREEEPEDIWPELDSEVDAEGRKFTDLEKDLMKELLHYSLT